MGAPTQRDFRYGRLAPSFFGRADLGLYSAGLKEARNVYVKRMGGLTSRPGTIYKGTTKGNAAVVLVDAVFDDAENYILEFGNLYVRVWRDGALVTVGTPSAWLTATPYTAGTVVANDGDNYVCILDHTSGASTEPGTGASWQTNWYLLVDDIFEYPTDYTTVQLDALQFNVQYHEVRITHPAHPPARLTWLAEASWVWADIDFAQDASIPTGLAVSGTSGTRWGYALAAVYPASDPRGPIGPATGFLRTNTSTLPYIAQYQVARSLDPRTITWNAVDGATSYLLYLQFATGGDIYSISVTGTSYVDSGSAWSNYPTSTYTANSDATEPVFDAAGKYPAVVGAFQQRLIFAAADDTPDVVVASRVASPDTFFASDPIVDSDAMSWRQVGSRLNRIRFFAEVAKKLWQFSSVAEAEIQGDTDGILRPGEVNPRVVSQNGISPTVPPLVVGDAVLYVQARGNQVMDLWPDGSGSEVSRAAWDLLDGYEIVSWCFQRTPDRVVWAVRDDGKMLSLTYSREDEIVGWAWHDTDGSFERVVCVPEGDEDAVYAVVLRTIDGNAVRYVERMANRVAETPVCVDAGVVATTSLTNGVLLVPTSGFGAWTERATPALGYSAIASNDTVLVAVSFDGDTSPVIRSTNGTTWTAQAAGTSDYFWNDVIWVEDWGLFVAVSDGSGNTQNVMTSPDGITWTLRNAADASPSGYYSIAYADSLGLAVAVTGGNLVLGSTDGTTWTTETATGTVGGVGDKIVWSEPLGLFVAVGGGTIHTSTNGVAWTPRVIPFVTPSLNFRTLRWCGDRFAVHGGDNDGSSASVVLTSLDGITWTAQALPVASPFAVYGVNVDAATFNATAGVYMLLKDNDYITTDDFTTWTDYANAQPGDWYDLHYAPAFGRYVAAGVDGDATDIQDATFSASPQVTGLTWLEGESVSIAAGNTVVASPNNPDSETVVVTDGVAALPAGTYTTVTVGLPVTMDVQTLDIETSNGTRKDAGILVNKIGLWLEDTLGLSARADAPSSSTSLDGFQSLPVVDEDGNTTTDPVTGYREVSIDGVWTRGGSIFLRNVDPTPVTIHSISPQGTFGRS